MNRRTIHELAEVLATICDDQTIANLMNHTLATEDDERLNSYQCDLADTLFDSLTELRPDCITLAHEVDIDIPQPKRGMVDRVIDWLTGWSTKL